jgi:hypothetical protein
MDESAKTPPANEPDEITSDYANNVALEQTVWDLKLIFGEYSNRSGAVEWHTSITMPWPQAKLLSHYLRANVAVWEINHGPVAIPEAMIPQPLVPLTPEQARDPKQKAVFETIKALQDRFIKDLPKKP